MNVRTESAEAMQDSAGLFTAGLVPAETAVVVTLSGELGAGKTTFAQGVARALGVEEAVTSPTFVLEKIYELENRPFRRLVHIDAYRLQNERELEVLGWADISADPENLIVLEWPERVAGIIPEHAIALRFDIEGEERIITSIYGEESSKKEDADAENT